ncbi:MAG: DUF2062 domain-containing protein [Desulfuromonadales bacterium]|nr:DUF2062 domain-containing protein [Desulfuromonadales bacterium]
MSIVNGYKLKKFFLSRFRALQQQLLVQVRQGLGNRDLALGLALGATLGIMPLVWGTSLLCAVMAAVLRLNQVVVQVANYLVYPIQIMLFLPFLYWGRQLSDSPSTLNDLDGLLRLVRQVPGQFLQQFWQVNLQALVVWLMLSPLIFVVLFVLVYAVVKGLPYRTFRCKNELSAVRHRARPPSQ